MLFFLESKFLCDRNIAISNFSSFTFFSKLRNIYLNIYFFLFSRFQKFLHKLTELGTFQKIFEFKHSKYIEKKDLFDIFWIFQDYYINGPTFDYPRL
jgi:hypothetical protein